MFDKLESIFAERRLAGSFPRFECVGTSELDENILGIKTTTGVAYFIRRDLSRLIDVLQEVEEEFKEEM